MSIYDHASANQHLMDQCIEDCATCGHAAARCVDACLGGEQAGSMAQCIRLCLDCVTITAACADMCGRTSPFAGQIARVCVDVCNACAAECEKGEGEVMRQCAEACRRCAQTCQQMAA